MRAGPAIFPLISGSVGAVGAAVTLALATFGLCLIAAGVVDRSMLERVHHRRRERQRERALLRKAEALGRLVSLASHTRPTC